MNLFPFSTSLHFNNSSLVIRELLHLPVFNLQCFLAVILAPCLIYPYFEHSIDAIGCAMDPYSSTSARESARDRANLSRSSDSNTPNTAIPYSFDQPTVQQRPSYSTAMAHQQQPIIASTMPVSPRLSTAETNSCKKRKSPTENDSPTTSENLHGKARKVSLAASPNTAAAVQGSTSARALVSLYLAY